MIRQKAISVKLDEDVYRQLRYEASMGSMKANRIVNEAVRLFCELVDKRRNWSIMYQFRGDEFNEELLRYANNRLRHIVEKSL